MKRRSLATYLLLGALLLGIPMLAQARVGSDEPFTLDVKNGEIRDVLRLIADKLEINMIIDEGVEGRLTVKFENISLEDALIAVLLNSGYYYEWKGNVVQVFSAELQNTRLMPVQYASAKDVETIIRGVYPDIGIQLVERNNSLLITASAFTLQKVEQMISEVDQPIDQVRITAQVVEITLDDDDDTGLEFSGMNGKSSFGFLDSQSLPQQGVNLLFNYGTLNASEFAAAIKAISTRSDSKLLNNPSVVTQDNREADITITDQHPYQEFSQPTSGSVNATGMFQVEYKESVIQLKVTPHITSEQAITMDIYSRVDRIIGQVEEYQAPGISKRESTTRVMVPDHHTVVIGGLISDTRETITGQIPFLGNLPLIGKLFQHNQIVNIRSELLIFITPDIIDEEKENLQNQTRLQKIREEFDREGEE